MTLPAFRTERLDERLGRAICRGEHYIDGLLIGTQPRIRGDIATQCIYALNQMGVAPDAVRGVCVRLAMFAEEQGDLRRRVIKTKYKRVTVRRFDGREIAEAIHAIVQETGGHEVYLNALLLLSMVHAWKNCEERADRMAYALKSASDDFYKV